MHPQTRCSHFGSKFPPAAAFAIDKVKGDIKSISGQRSGSPPVAAIETTQANSDGAAALH